MDIQETEELHTDEEHLERDTGWIVKLGKNKTDETIKPHILPENIGH